MSGRSIAVSLLIGLIAGWLASVIVGGGGLVRYIVTGLIGSFVGGWLLGALNVRIGIANPLLREIVVSTFGAIVVVVVARALA